jgi:hypothetical protein
MSMLTSPNDIQHIEIRLTDEPVKVCVNYDKARACFPIAQQPCLDVVWSNVALDEHIVVEETMRKSKRIISFSGISTLLLWPVQTTRRVDSLRGQVTVSVYVYTPWQVDSGVEASTSPRQFITAPRRLAAYIRVAMASQHATRAGVFIRPRWRSKTRSCN